jgi:hypothetical protein
MDATTTDAATTLTTTQPATTPTSKANRGKDQIHWSEGVWAALDHAVTEEMTRTRVAAKFLPHFNVDKKQTTVASDVVNLPSVTGDTAFSVDETRTNRVGEYWGTFKMSVAQVEEEEHQEAAMNNNRALAQPQAPAPTGNGQGQMSYAHRASTGVSLAMKTANMLAQAEDIILFNGQNGAVNSPLFIANGKVGPFIQALDPNFKTNLDLGLLNIQPLFVSTSGPSNDIQLPNPSQVIPVHPSPNSPQFVAGGPPPRYAENTLNAVASAFSVLQGLLHYEYYALVLHTIPYADLHQALAMTLVEPVEPVSHLVKAGIHGTSTLPPFTAYPPSTGPISTTDTKNLTQLLSTGLPTTIGGEPLTTIPGFKTNGTTPNVLYTGILVSLSGNTMDHVRGQMDEQQDVITAFTQKDQNEQYRFRVVQRFALRLKDPSAVILFLFLDA